MNNRSCVFVLFLSFTLALGCITSLEAQSKFWRERFESVGYNVAINPRNPNTIYAEDRKGLLNVSRDKGKSWTALNPVPGPFRGIRNILVHPKDTLTIFILRDQGGMWKTVNEGTTWYDVIPNFGIDGESISFDPQHPDTMYAGDFFTTNIFRSTNRGDTWTIQSTLGTMVCGLTVRPDNGNIILAGTGNGTMGKSTDAGVTWTQVYNAGTNEVPKIVFNPANPMIGYANVFVDNPPETNCGLIKTTDGGDTWFRTPILQDTSLWSIVLDEAHPETVYVGRFSSNGYGIDRTTDGGLTYQHFQDGIKIDFAGGYSGFSAWNLKLNPLAPNDLWLAGSTNSFSAAWPGAIYHFVDNSTTIISGVVRDINTNGPIGATMTTENLDSLDLGLSGGSYSLRYYSDDPTLTPAVHLKYPQYYYPKDTMLTFVPNTTQNLDLYLTPLPANSISGMVFNDLNGNRVKDIGEPGLANWRVDVSGPSSVFTHTDANGHYSINSLTGGIYTVSESLQAGFSQTIPLSLPSCPGTYNAPVGFGFSNDNIDFGNQAIAPGATLMYQDFTTTTFPPPCWGVVNANGGFTWLRATTAFKSPPASARNGTGAFVDGKPNDWLYFGPIRLQANKIYRLSWWDRTFTFSGFLDSLTVTVGLNPPVSTSQIINDRGFLTSLTNDFVGEDVQQDFSVGADSLYYIGFHDHSAAGNTIRIDDVMLKYMYDILPVDLSLGSLTPSSPPLANSPKNRVTLPPIEQSRLKLGGDLPDGGGDGHISLERWTKKGAVSTTVVRPTKTYLNHAMKSTTVYNDSVNMIVQNNGQSSASYSINWSVSGGAQTPYSGGPVNSLQSQAAKLLYSTSVLGSHHVLATVNTAGDGNGTNDQTTGRSRVYPAGMIPLLYDDGNTSPLKGTVGFGVNSSFTAAVRFTATQMLQLGQVDAFINNMGSADSLLVRVWNAGANNNTPGDLLYSKKFGGSDYVSESPSGEYLSLPLDNNAPSFLNGSNFWVSITYTGLPFPQGADYGGDPSRSLYSGDIGNTLNWKPAFSSWLLRAIGTPLSPGTASISGLKYHDLNGNGSNNSEPPLQGWTIILSGSVNGNMQTDVNGLYSFAGLPAGDYTVGEVQQTGWTQVSSPGTYNITLTSGQSSTGNDFGNFQYIISGTKYDDANGDSSVVGDSPFNGYIIKLYKGGVFQSRTITSGAGYYVFTGLTPGTYTVEESLRVGWVQTIPRVGDPGVTLTTYGTNAGPRAYSITVGPVTPDTGKNFGNYRAGSLTVRKFEDTDGDFYTNGDRVAKNWHLEIHKGTVGGPLLASGDASSIAAINLPSDWYYAVEADSTGWTHNGVVLDGIPYGILSGGGNNAYGLYVSASNSTVDFVNAPPAFGQMYRTAKSEDWANALDHSLKRKSVKRKADKVKFKFNIVAPSAATGFTLKFNMRTDARISTGKAKADTLRLWTGKDTVNYIQPINSGDTLQVEGIGIKGMKLKTTVIWRTSPHSTTVRLTDANYKENSLRLPLPNLHNVGEELFPMGFGQNTIAFPTGMVVGVPQGTHGAHSVLHKKYTDVLKTLVKISGHSVLLHENDPRCLDVFNGIAGNGHPIDRQQIGLSPDKHNNQLLAELTALKLNVAASAYNKFPNGLGGLTFLDASDPGNLLNGQTIDTIIVKADRVISCLVDLTKGDTLTPGEVYDVIERIDSAFSSGVIDTNSFATKTSLTGVRRLIDVPFLHPTPGIVPENHISPPVVIEAMPVKYGLHQNYPNPFNPSTTIQFELPNPAIVTLKVYNVLGQEVATLLNRETMEDGSQAVEFNAGNLSSGVYFYRIIAEPIANEDGAVSGEMFRSVKKMLLLK